MFSQTFYTSLRKTEPINCKYLTETQLAGFSQSVPRIQRTHTRPTSRSWARWYRPHLGLEREVNKRSFCSRLSQRSKLPRASRYSMVTRWGQEWSDARATAASSSYSNFAGNWNVKLSCIYFEKNLLSESKPRFNWNTNFRFNKENKPTLLFKDLHCFSYACC